MVEFVLVVTSAVAAAVVLVLLSGEKGMLLVLLALEELVVENFLCFCPSPKSSSAKD